MKENAKLDGPTSPSTAAWVGWAALVARGVVGGLFLWMGWSKAMDPVGFLKLVRQYEVLPGPGLLNAVAVVVPWLEMVCGLLLLAGRAVRGTALVSLVLLAVFTALVWHRALGVREATGVAMCAVRFDCGCGAGEVWICRKIVENSLLLVLSAFLVYVPAVRWPWRAGVTPG
ncbi:MAG: DoxX family protein [Verrucomicrobiales bacterium]|nr:DoxX family protein [Verrucomicrobiales bacterium]